MQRRKSLELMAGLGPMLLLSGNSTAGQPHDNDEWLTHFKFRWDNSRTYCFEVFDAMPTMDFNYKPNAELMTFAKLFVHITSGLHGFAGVLDGSELNREPKTVNKEAVADFLNDAFDHFNKALDAMDINDLYAIKHAKADKEPWKEFSIFDIITLGYNHTVHHMAQATVFLRLKNIAPPQYRF